MFADLVILNGTICTVDRLFSYCQAVAVRQGTIIDRGTTDQMKAYIGKDTKARCKKQESRAKNSCNIL